MKKLILAVAAVCSVAAFAETKVGIIGCDTSHTLAFTKIMNVDKADFCRDFRVAVAYQWGSRDIPSCTNRYEKYLAELKGNGVELVPSIAELLAKCDVVCLETCDGREHLAQAEEVFKSGKLVFIDKPIAEDYAHAKAIYELGKKYGAKYFSSSALRYPDEVQDLVAGKYGKVTGGDFFSPYEVEPTHGRYSWYAIHGFEPLVAVMGRGAESVRTTCVGDSEIVVVRYRDGRLATLRLNRKSWNYGGLVHTDKGKPVVLPGYQGYECLLKRILEFFRTGVVPVSNEETLEIFAIMDAAETSYNLNGVEVRVK